MCVWFLGGLTSCNPLALLNPFKTTLSTTLTSSLGELQSHGALVVGWRPINTAVRVDRDRTVGVFGYPIPLGEVHILLEVPGNRAQYIIEADNSWAAEEVSTDVVIVTLPPPIVNDKVVEVQSDPSQIRVYIDNDWVEHLIPSGGDIDQARRLLRESVIHTAQQPAALAEVRIEARQTVQRLFEGAFSGATGRPIRVIVQFSDEKVSRPSSDDAPQFFR